MRSVIARLNVNASASESRFQHRFVKWLLRISCTYLFVHAIACSPISAAQKFEYTKQAEFDAEGNIFVSSDEGKLIKMAGPHHCETASVAPDKQTVGCLVMRGLEPEKFSQPLQVEIYLKGGRKITIEPGAPIREWHFWKNGQQLAIFWGKPNTPATHGLYDIPASRFIETLTEPSDERSLPQWPKNDFQILVESVPSSPKLNEERTKWITKVLYETRKIKPGMRRKDLLKIFTTEGGISTRFERTYVHIECPYIKVDVRFKAAGNDNDALREDPEDIIESISQPYLAWSVMD